jgi:hypothetical protein
MKLVINTGHAAECELGIDSRANAKHLHGYAGDVPSAEFEATFCAETNRP